MSDDFARTVTAGLGSATVGGAYSTTGSAGDYAVSAGAGTIRTAAGVGRSALLTASGGDVDITLSFRLDTLPQAGSAWIYAVARRSAAGNEYRAKVRIAPDGSIYVAVSRVVAGSEISIGPEIAVSGASASGGQWLRLHARLTGANPTALKARAWPAASAEPSTWQVSLTDAAPEVQGAGSVGLRTYVAKSATGPAIGFGFDDFVIAAIDPPPPPTGGAAILAGAGDIAGCSNGGAFQTANLLDEIAGTIFTAGDNAYPDGSAAAFANCFDPPWGRFKSRLLPAPGNHEFQTAGGAGYFGYFGAAAGPPGLGYYATDVGSWRLYSLNSECASVSCSSEASWLTSDLAANPRQCVVAIWHEPRFSSGPHGGNPAVGPFWQALYNANAELVINGHDHDYERFAPLDPTGLLDTAHGLREIIAGTGGIGGGTLTSPQANSVVFDGGTSGVLKLTLRATEYDWQFIPVAGKTFTDSGTGSCH